MPLPPRLSVVCLRSVRLAGTCAHEGGSWPDVLSALLPGGGGGGGGAL